MKIKDSKQNQRLIICRTNKSMKALKGTEFRKVGREVLRKMGITDFFSHGAFPPDTYIRNSGELGERK